MTALRTFDLGRRTDRWTTRAASAALQSWPAWIAVLCALALSILGIYAIDVAETLRPTPGESALSSAALRQLAFLVVAIAGAAIVALPHYRTLGYASWFLLGAAILLLLFLLLPFVPASIVRVRNGARSWIDVGPVDIQPAELAKIAYVIALAWYLRYRENHRTLRGLLPPAILTAIPVGLITLQPDLGSALLFIPALFAVLVAAGARLKHLALIVCLAALAAPASYPLLKPHQQARIVGLIKQVQGDTSRDQDINMQPVTAQRLIGAGGLSGVGDEKARVLLHYNALPERHNDMIYAVIVNRFGLLGGVTLLALYFTWIAAALLVAARCRDAFGRLIAVGVTGFIAAQVVVNVGMNVGLLPVIGVTLPFVSHGGSSMVAVWLMTGLLASVAMRQPPMSLRKPFEWADD